jgi:HK97 family phage major capsid protein
LSVGFDPIEEVFDKSFNGFRFPKWKWLELSTVTIPANEAATMSSVRSADEAILAAIGTRERTTVVRLNLNSPGASGHSKGKNMKNIREHIAALEAKRAANDEKLDGILAAVADAGQTRDQAQQEEFDNLTRENEQLDKDIEAFKTREKSMLARATPILPAKEGADPEKEGKEQRGYRPAIEVRKNEEKGIGFARMAIAMMRADGNPFHAAELAKQYYKDSPEVGQYIRTIIEAGDTTTSGWASQLLPAAQQMSNEFLDLLRARILIGRIPNLRPVPFNVAVPLQSGGGTYGYVGEGAAKPVTKPTFSSATLRFEKAAGIIVITEELARFSNPSAELLVRNELLEGLTRFFDGIFFSALAAVTNVQPAGILNGISAVAASGTTAAFFRANFNTIMQNHITNNRDPQKLVILMGAGMAMKLASMMNSLGQAEFPTINASGGNYLGVPIVTSQACGNHIALIDPTDILIAEDPAIRIDVSREATIEMSDAPVAGEGSPASAADAWKSMFQNNMIAIRAEQFRTWKVARTSAVEYISNGAYAPST